MIDIILFFIGLASSFSPGALGNVPEDEGVNWPLHPHPFTLSISTTLAGSYSSSSSSTSSSSLCTSFSSTTRAGGEQLLVQEEDLVLRHGEDHGGGGSPTRSKGTTL